MLLYYLFTITPRCLAPPVWRQYQEVARLISGIWAAANLRNTVASLLYVQML